MGAHYLSNTLSFEIISSVLESADSPKGKAPTDPVGHCTQ